MPDYLCIELSHMCGSPPFLTRPLETQLSRLVKILAIFFLALVRPVFPWRFTPRFSGASRPVLLALRAPKDYSVGEGFVQRTCTKPSLATFLRCPSEGFMLSCCTKPSLELIWRRVV